MPIGRASASNPDPQSAFEALENRFGFAAEETRTLSPSAADSGRGNRPRLDHDAGDAVLLGQAGRLLVRVAGAGERAVGLEELRVAIAVRGRVRVCRRDPKAFQLRVVLDQLRVAEAAPAQLEQLS